MRRLVVLSASLLALAAPAAAWAFHTSPGDGTLVVKNANGAAKVPVVQLDVTGAVIGHIDSGTIWIAPSADADVTGWDTRKNSPRVDDAQGWTALPGGTGMKFRAVGANGPEHFTIVIYGTGVDVVAVGHGTVTLTGLPDSGGDGWFSLNGGDLKSLPGPAAAKQQTIGGDSNG